MQQTYKHRYGSPIGLLLTLLTGFILYFLLNLVQANGTAYTNLISSIHEPSSQLQWFLMNFTEAEFYAGPITSIFLILGSVVAYLLGIKKSRFRGFEICYGNARIWPWVFASQILSMLLTEYIFGYLKLFETGLTWIPTFIVIVSVPPSMVLMYGPGLKTLLTASVIGSVICTPSAYWISQATSGLNIPGAANNVFAMAVSGIIAACVCHVLPWMEKKACESSEEAAAEAVSIDYDSPLWVLRRTIADLSEPQFYGSDIVSVFILAGVILEWLINPGILTGGAAALPAIILSQFISGGIGVFLYTGKYQEHGWYATYVPVVCTAPACILLHGSSMTVILVSSILGGIIGAPIAQWLDDRRPDFIHGTVCNVVAMGVSTILVSAVITCIPWC